VLLTGDRSARSYLMLPARSNSFRYLPVQKEHGIVGRNQHTVRSCSHTTPLIIHFRRLLFAI
jgi:hypothetical protein